MYLNICKTSTVLTVICITYLLVFTKLNSDTRYLYPIKYRYEHQNQNSSNLSILAEKQSRSDNRAYSSYSLLSGAWERGLKYQRMDNNNTQVNGTMGSPEMENTKGPAQKIEDVDKEDLSGQFNIKMLNEHLKRCIRSSDHEVDMDEYIKLFQQLYKFFCMLGTVFSFIGSDVKSKIEILKGHHEGNDKAHYETVEKMIAFEKSTEYLQSNKESNGARTFLRLHRALIFVSKFLGKMDSIGDQDGTSRICKDAYAQTLAKFHPWLIQKGAGLAMMGLPLKKDLIAKVSANGMVDSHEVIPIMHDVIRLTAEIYDHCDKLYTENDLHGLP